MVKSNKVHHHWDFIEKTYKLGSKLPIYIYIYLKNAISTTLLKFIANIVILFVKVIVLHVYARSPI